MCGQAVNGIISLERRIYFEVGFTVSGNSFLIHHE